MSAGREHLTCLRCGSPYGDVTIQNTHGSYEACLDALRAQLDAVMRERDAWRTAATTYCTAARGRDPLDPFGWTSDEKYDALCALVDAIDENPAREGVG